jgi:hypothetical protein
MSVINFFVFQAELSFVVLYEVLNPQTKTSTLSLKPQPSHEPSQ